MDNVVPTAPAAPAVSSPPQQDRAHRARQRRPGAGALLTLVNGVLAGVGSVYVGTHSVLVTVIAATVATALAVLVLVFQR